MMLLHHLACPCSIFQEVPETLSIVGQNGVRRPHFGSDLSILKENMQILDFEKKEEKEKKIVPLSLDRFFQQSMTNAYDGHFLH